VSVREFSDGADDWMDRGACRNQPGVDPEWFFSKLHADIDQAKQVCAGCQVAAPCLAYAVRHREVGVWGGSDDNDRKRGRSLGRPVPRTCRNGHLMTPDNVHYRADGGRRCRECWRAYARDRYGKLATELSVIRGGKP
jgi:hypothetical protein